MSLARQPDSELDDEKCCVMVYSGCCPERETLVNGGQKICCIVGLLGGLVGGYFLVKTKDLFNYFSGKFNNNVIGGGAGVTIVVLGFGCAGVVIGKYCLGAGIGNACHDF